MKFNSFLQIFVSVAIYLIATVIKCDLKKQNKMFIGFNGIGERERESKNYWHFHMIGFSLITKLYKTQLRTKIYFKNPKKTDFSLFMEAGAKL